MASSYDLFVYNDLFYYGLKFACKGESRQTLTGGFLHVDHFKGLNYILSSNEHKKKFEAEPKDEDQKKL